MTRYGPLLAIATLAIAACGDAASESPNVANTSQDVAGIEPADTAASEARFPIPEPLLIGVRGSNYRWILSYPGRDGVLDTDDDVVSERHVHVPRGVRTKLRLHSDDFLYTFALPGLGLKEIAVPDLEFALEFAVAEPGEYELLGDNFCGFSHEQLIGKLVVESKAEFDEYLKAASISKSDDGESE